MMSLSFDEGMDWKEATVTPIYKKGDKRAAGNYPPINLTYIVCRTMDKIISAQLRQFMARENIVTCEQHGLTPGAIPCNKLVVLHG